MLVFEGVLGFQLFESTSLVYGWIPGLDPIGLDPQFSENSHFYQSMILNVWFGNWVAVAIFGSGFDVADLVDTMCFCCTQMEDLRFLSMVLLPSWSRQNERWTHWKRRFQEEEIPESVTATETRQVDWRMSMARLHVWHTRTRILFLFRPSRWCPSIRYVHWYCCFCHGTCVLGMFYFFIHFFVQPTLNLRHSNLQGAMHVYPVVQWPSSLFSFEHLKETLGKNTNIYIYIYIIIYSQIYWQLGVLQIASGCHNNIWTLDSQSEAAFVVPQCVFFFVGCSQDRRKEGQVWGKDR